VFSTLPISNQLMKTYLKHPYEKRVTAIYYSSSDILTQFSAHVNFQQRVVQPSTKEQQRLLLSSTRSRLQHVHVGKYGIKPLEPSDSLLCKQQKFHRKSRKVIIIYETIYALKKLIVCLNRSKSL
jgi:hypothetical protein